MTLCAQLSRETKFSYVDHRHHKQVNDHELDEGSLEDEYVGSQRCWISRAARLPIASIAVNIHQSKSTVEVEKRNKPKLSLRKRSAIAS